MRAQNRIAAMLRRLRADQSGATLVEFAIVLPIFLLIFFALIDFGRLAFHYVTAEKSMQVAARIAAVRPAACAGVPQTHQRGPVLLGVAPPRFGTSCRSGANVCANPGPIACAGSASSATAQEIWGIIGPAMPNDATIANLRFIYSYDSNLGFLGGPYVPVVTVEIRNLTFEFVSPLGALAALAGATDTVGLGADIVFPSMSVSLPGEDLALGEAG